MKITTSFIASMIITSIIMVIIALCVSLTFDVPYTEVVHSVGYGVFSFFAVIALPMITGREVYEYMEEKGY